MTTYAIVGFGCAGYYALTAIRQWDSNGVIHIYSDHNAPPYNPMLTTYYASNRLNQEGLFPFGNLEEIAKKYNATIFTNSPVTSLYAPTKTLILKDGNSHSYDKILISTGATAFIPPFENQVPEKTFYMRNLSDAEVFKSKLADTTISSAVVVGASMTGIKITEALVNQKIKTTLVDFAPHIFSLAAFPKTAEKIQEEIAGEYLSFMFSTGITGIQKGKNGEALVHCNNGTVLSTDLVGLCIGTRATTNLVNPEQIKVGRGILVDNNMETSVKGIYSAGDCCEGQNRQTNTSMIIGLWANAAYQGYTAGANMADNPETFTGNIPHNISHFFHLDFIGLGSNIAHGNTHCYSNPKKNLWIEACKVDGKLSGMNIIGNSRISGILKNHFLDILENGSCNIDPMQRGVLLKEGIDTDFLSWLEGEQND